MKQTTTAASSTQSDKLEPYPADRTHSMIIECPYVAQVFNVAKERRPCTQRTLLRCGECTLFALPERHIEQGAEDVCFCFVGTVRPLSPSASFRRSTLGYPVLLK